MKQGRIAETVWKRSVRRRMRNKREDILQRMEIGYDAAILDIREAENMAVTMKQAVFSASYQIQIAVTRTANALACMGAQPSMLLAAIILPVFSEEKALKIITEILDETCSSLGMALGGVQAEISSSVKEPLAVLTGSGPVKKQIQSLKNLGAGLDIVVTEYIGSEGAAVLAFEKERCLQQRYSSAFIESAKERLKKTSALLGAAAAVQHGAEAMHAIEEGGIFGALWELAEGAGLGLEIDLKKIPIKQQTIEICGVFDINPYLIASAGSILIVDKNGYDLVRELEKAGVQAAVIGKTTEGNARLLLNEEEKRFLEPPKTDELLKIISCEEEDLA